MSELLESSGLFLFSHPYKSLEKAFRFGNKTVIPKGHLTSQAHRGEWTLFLDGLLIDKPNNNKTDAEYLLDLFVSSKLGSIHKLNGFFNIIVINNDGNKVHFISDLLCSRPWYLYNNNNTCALAPSPTAFAKDDLSMSIDRQALYEQIRLLHTGHDRTLIQEVRRILPGYSYSIQDDTLLKKKTYQFKQEPNTELTLEECASWIKKICQNTIQGVLNHPKLQNIPVQLPLTGGLDSRHLLGELLDQNHKPDYLTHIRIQEKDYQPVKQIAESLSIRLQSKPLDKLNILDLTQRWANKSGGLVNFHQHYLLSIKNQVIQSPTISFNGYLMDWFLGMATKTKIKPEQNTYMPIWNRTYSSTTIRKLLIPNEHRWANATKKLFEEELKNYKGEPWFCLMLLDLHHRGLHYTGIVDTMLSDEVFSFSPGAVLDSYRFLATAPHEVAGDKKARLKALKKYFPEIAAFPSSEGIPFDEMEVKKEIVNNPVIKNAKKFLYSFLSGFQKDIASESEHAWIRNIPLLHRLHKNAVYESELAQDGYLNRIGLKTCWRINQLGGYQGWTLMSILSAEVTYRILVKKRSPNTVVENLSKPS